MGCSSLGSGVLGPKVCLLDTGLLLQPAAVQLRWRASDSSWVVYVRMATSEACHDRGTVAYTTCTHATYDDGVAASPSSHTHTWGISITSSFQQLQK
jgi:hypothetical protein